MAESASLSPSVSPSISLSVSPSLSPSASPSEELRGYIVTEVEGLIFGDRIVKV